VLAAQYTSLQTVTHAHGSASRARERGKGNAAKLTATVAAEMDAFSNVSAHGFTQGVTPHQVLDYAYWQLVTGESPRGSVSRRAPLHDILLKRRGSSPQAERSLAEPSS
jgi:hypothetical protein